MTEKKEPIPLQKQQELQGMKIHEQTSPQEIYEKYLFLWKKKCFHLHFLTSSLNTKSFKIHIILLLFLTGVQLPVHFQTLACTIFSSMAQRNLHIALTLFLVGAVLIGWCLCVQHFYLAPPEQMKEGRTENLDLELGSDNHLSLNNKISGMDDSTLNQATSTFSKGQIAKVIVYHAYLLSLRIYLIALFFTYCFSPLCNGATTEKDDFNVSCKNGETNTAAVMLLLCSSIVLSSIYPESLFEIQCCYHFAVCISCFIVLGLVASPVINGYLLIVVFFWLFGGLALLYDLRIHYLGAFIDFAKKVSQTLNEVAVKNLIGNVAHDLKTPLASFNSGVDMIEQLLDDCSALEPSSASGHSCYEVRKERDLAIKDSISNIRDTNTFMLMSINRCIDYTKASRGFKLVPKYETLSLQDTLQLPLNCMKNIQDRIQIQLEPINTTEICSHIITDKQWLQENVLCLLSNAVKYSTDGQVNIRISLGPTNIHSCRSPQSSSLPESPTKIGGRTSMQAKWATSSSIRGGDNSSPLKRTLSSMNAKFFSEKEVGLLRKSLKLFTSKVRINPETSYIDPVALRESPTPSRRHASNGDSSIDSLEDLAYDGNSTHNHSNATTPSKPTAAVSGSLDDTFSSKTVGRNSMNTAKLLNSFRPTPDGSTNHIRKLKPTGSTQRLCTHHLKVEVEDTGIGMTAEAMSQLFNPFKQAQRLAGGTGLGLYSLAKRMEALNGSYGVSRRPDGQKGSLFWFSIPYRPDQTTADLVTTFKNLNQLTKDPSPIVTQAKKVLLPGGVDRFPHPGCAPRHRTNSIFMLEGKRLSSSHFKGMLTKSASTNSSDPLNILIVDDSPSILKMSSMMLRRQGHSMCLAENGEIALKKIEEQWSKTGRGFDVILMDLQMPVMDGLEAARRLRKFEKEDKYRSLVFATSPRSPESTHSASAGTHQFLICISANADEETEQEVFDAGFDAYMPKPFTLELFNNTIQTCLSSLQ